MLDHILRAFSNYEKKHTMTANVLDINYRQYRILLEEYPTIFGPDAQVELGFHVCLHSELEQPNPGVRYMAGWYSAPKSARLQASLLENQGKKIQLKTM